MPGYEPRPQQAQMAAAVASAIAEGAHTVIEAGTGVGKTLAYLVPAALHASSGGKPVIVSTNTINLQEQLLGKDLPVARGVMEGLRQQTTGPTELRAAQLKGRANYICFKKWAYAAQSGAAADIDARVVAKCLIWLQETETGDRAEIGLGREGAAFARLSAQGAKGCPSPDGPCFLRKARSEAQGADIIVINHSLLLSEVAHDAGLLPEHDALIIDEAHHLEAVATRHLGFDVTEPQLGADLAPLQGERGLIMQLAQVCQSLGAARALNLAPAAAAAALTGAARASERAGEFFGALRAFATNHAMPGEERADLRLTPGLRAQPDWSGVEVAWENLDAPLAETLSGLQALVTQAESSAPLNPDAQAVLLNVSTAADALLKGRAGLRQAVAEPSKDMIYWAELAERGAGSQARRWVSVHGAPLRVGPILAEKLFKRERCVVMTGATLSSDRAVDRLRTAVGLESSRDLLLGSPFDYRSAALIVVPEDIPEPGAAGYAKAVASAISGIGLALRDRTLVLFTSNSAMETARKAVAPGLQREGVRVVAQGVDGPPHRIMRSLAETQACIAMGAASLWEGVDINSGAGNGPGSDREAGANLSIRALVMPRLPFPVPTDPIFAARSELYEDSFNDYAVPEAVLRFRQGFGRLIRSKSDRGAFVVLDRRILTKQYGIEFQRALPKCTVRRVSLGDLGATVARWNMGEEV
jgi:DNA polymerase-3 subunit epsilon/ATP-dependent DNA helicase DinG